jgi:hypothetical protein
MQVETTDHQRFNLSASAIANSSVLQAVYDSCQTDIVDKKTNTPTSVPIPYASNVFKWIFEYMELLTKLPSEQHRIPTPLNSPDMRFAVGAQQHAYLQRLLTEVRTYKPSITMYMDIMTLALAYDVDSLVSLLCAQLAAWIKGKSPQDSELLLRGVVPL